MTFCIRNRTWTPEPSWKSHILRHSPHDTEPSRETRERCISPRTPGRMQVQVRHNPLEFGRIMRRTRCPPS